MKAEIKVPSMGESITEATVGSILKPNGTTVKADDEIIELETDKVNQVLYAPQDGVLSLNVAEEDVVTIDQVIGFIEANGAPTAAAPVSPAAEVGPSSTPTPAPVQAPATPTTPASTGSVEKVTRESFVSEVKGGGGAAPSPVLSSPPTPTPHPVTAPTPTPSASPEGRESRKRMSKIRQVIAKRLVDSQQTTAMLTTFNEVDMSSVMELRKKHKDAFFEKHGVKLGFMSFFVKAAVSALKAFPGINSYIDGDEVVERHYYDIGIAVGTDRGLMVPVLRDCDQLSLAQIEGGILAFAKKAREGSINLDDLQGGSFTITNGGIYGSMLSTPILNPPQSGILGMHNIVQRPVAVNGEVKIRPIMYLALSYDHRIVDGKEAVSFLVNIKNCIEDPSRLILEL